MKKTEYVFLWGNTQSCFTFEGNTNCLVRFPDNPWNKALEAMITVVKDNKASCYVSQKSIDNNIKLGRQFLDARYVKIFLQNIHRVTVRHDRLFKELDKLNYRSLGDEELLNYFIKILNQWSDTIGYFRGTQMEGTQVLANKINKLVGPEEAATLILPTDLDPVNREEKDWRKLLKRPFSKKSIFNHLQKYPWLVPYHVALDQAYRTMQDRYKQGRGVFENRDIRKEKADLKRKQGAIFKQYPNAERLVKLMQQLALARINLKSYWGGTDFYLMPLYAEMARRSGEPIADIFNYYLIEELKALLNRRKLTREEKQNRKRCFVFLWKKGKIIIRSGDAAEKLSKKELGSLTETGNANELKGFCANPGKITGVVRIFEANNYKKANALRKSFGSGEVLVTQMTQPNIVDIAKKAVAIITDEGGMLSHAAIISREFGIPCVVGTHIATQVLKDGDLVEVDANKGLVKILKRKNAN